MMRWSSPSLRPSEVILSILSTSGLTAPLCTLDARSERAFTMSCWICVGFCGDGVVRNLRRGQVELIRRFDVGNLFEQIHQFGQVEKTLQSASLPGSRCPPGQAPARWWFHQSGLPSNQSGPYPSLAAGHAANSAGWCKALSWSWKPGCRWQTPRRAHRSAHPCSGTWRTYPRISAHRW